MLVAGQGRLEEAEMLLRQAHAAQPGEANLSFNLGLLLAERGQRDESERMLRTALEADPRLAPAAYNLAVLIGERRPTEAVALARKAAELQPDAARYAWTLAYFQARAGDLRGAADTLEALLRTHPGEKDARALLEEVRARAAISTERQQQRPRRASPVR